MIPFIFHSLLTTMSTTTAAAEAAVNQNDTADNDIVRNDDNDKQITQTL